jgi:predicted nuclease of restriction endonuclease-like (RecB) superfamily
MADSKKPGSSKPSKPTRRTRGKAREDASFPVAPLKVEMPAEYPQLLSEIKQRIQQERLKIVLAANSAMVLLYWDLGKLILAKQESDGWGAKVIDRLSADLGEAFPGAKGFSPRNLKYMRAFAAAWPERTIVQAPLAQITWYHNIALLERLSDPETRLWYARMSFEHGWSRNILALQIEGRAHERYGKAINNFTASLPPATSDMAAQIFKDPYLFDFLGTADPRKEHEVELALVDHIQKFLLELGAGFAFVGRQVHLEVGNQDFYLDLLFYHLKLRCYVVIELKAVSFEPGFVGQLNMYLAATDDLLRHPDDKPTIGLLLCRTKNQLVVEYSLRGVQSPIGVADWYEQVSSSLPENLKGSLPSIEEIEAELKDPESSPPTNTMKKK